MSRANEVKNFMGGGKRYSWIDIVKGIGVVLVIISHVHLFPENIGYFLDSFFMPLFFIAGGCSMGISYERNPFSSLKDFIVKRFYNLILPLLILQFINYLYYSFAYLAGMEEKWDFMLCFIGIFINIRMTWWANGFWFLSAFFIAELITLILVKTIYRYKNGKLMFVFSLFLLYGFGYYYISQVGVKLPWNVDIGLFCASFIGIGFLLWDCRFIEKITEWKFLILWVLVGTTAFMFMPMKNYCSYWASNFRYPILMFCTALGYSFLLISISKIVGSNKILEFLGRNSLAYYAIGSMIQRTLSVLINKGLEYLVLSDAVLYFVGILEVFLTIMIATVGVLIYRQLYDFLQMRLRLFFKKHCNLSYNKDLDSKMVQ